MAIAWSRERLLFTADILKQIEGGRVTVALRLWRRPTVKAGGTLRTPLGVLRIDAVEVASPDDVTDADARLAGEASRQALLDGLPDAEGRDFYRIDFHRESDDPRIALRADQALAPADRAALTKRLQAMDARTDRPWTGAVLGAIASSEGEAAGSLADMLGMEKPLLKARIRRLKDIGLTESLTRGYRLSPRGRAFLEAQAAGR